LNNKIRNLWGGIINKIFCDICGDDVVKTHNETYHLPLRVKHHTFDKKQFDVIINKPIDLCLSCEEKVAEFLHKILEENRV